MRNISFMLTTDQILSRTKTVTRRVGWSNLVAGQMLRGVEKCRGLKAGEKVKELAVIRVVSVRQEQLKTMTEDLAYGSSECVKEGFGEHHSLRWPSQFVDFFCRSHRGCTPETLVTRIEFEFVN